MSYYGYDVQSDRLRAALRADRRYRLFICNYPSFSASFTKSGVSARYQLGFEGIHRAEIFNVNDMNRHKVGENCNDRYCESMIYTYRRACNLLAV